MAGAIETSHLALVDTLMNALQEVGHARTPTTTLLRFLGRPPSSSDQTIDEWLADFEVFVDSVVCRRESERWCWWTTLVGVRSRKCICHSDEVRRDFGISAVASVWAMGDRDVAVC